DKLSDSLIEMSGETLDATRVHLEVAVVRLVGPTSSPRDTFRSGRISKERASSDAVHRAINSLSENPDLESGRALEKLIGNPALMAWKPNLRHAQARHILLRRDRDFRHPR